MSSEAVSTQIADLCTFPEGRALVANFPRKGERYRMKRWMGSWASSYQTATPPHTFENYMHRAAVPILERGSNHECLPRSRWLHNVVVFPYLSIQGPRGA